MPWNIFYIVLFQIKYFGKIKYSSYLPTLPLIMMVTGNKKLFSLGLKINCNCWHDMLTIRSNEVKVRIQMDLCWHSTRDVPKIARAIMTSFGRQHNNEDKEQREQKSERSNLSGMTKSLSTQCLLEANLSKGGKKVAREERSKKSSKKTRQSIGRLMIWFGEHFEHQAASHQAASHLTICEEAESVSACPQTVRCVAFPSTNNKQTHGTFSIQTTIH